MKIVILLLTVFVVSVMIITGCSKKAETSGQTDTVNTAKQQVSVDLGEWYVKLDPTTVNAGSIQFNIKNTGGKLHAYEIDGQGIDKESKTLDPGQSTTMTVDLKSGKYKTYCPIDKHEEAGMVTTFTVR
ncbi:MAG: cupredoxin domain-containing protein [Armatimonadota bacterium]